MANNWTDPTLTPLVTKVKTTHVEELRTVSDQMDDLLDNHVGQGGTQHATATQSEAGFMSSDDKRRVDGYTHTQSTPASTWNVTHNLNKYPRVVLMDGNKELIVGDVFYTDLNTVTVIFNSKISGTAYVS